MKGDGEGNAMKRGKRGKMRCSEEEKAKKKTFLVLREIKS